MKKLVAILLVAVASAIAAAPKDDPADFIRALYKEHDAGRGPFFQDDDKKVIARWFDTRLTELIWRDAVEAAGEVGRLDADPLYDSQDTDMMKNLRFRTVAWNGKTARVLVTYDQFHHKYTIDYRLKRGKNGWRITNIHWPRWNGDLVTTLSFEF